MRSKWMCTGEIYVLFALSDLPWESGVFCLPYWTRSSLIPLSSGRSGSACSSSSGSWFLELEPIRSMAACVIFFFLFLFLFFLRVLVCVCGGGKAPSSGYSYGPQFKQKPIQLEWKQTISGCSRKVSVPILSILPLSFWSPCVPLFFIVELCPAICFLLSILQLFSSRFIASGSRTWRIL